MSEVMDAAFFNLLRSMATNMSEPIPELTFEQERAAYNAIMEEGERQHVSVWGPQVSVRDAHNFIRAAYAAIKRNQ